MPDANGQIPDAQFEALIAAHGSLPENEGADKVVPLEEAVARLVEPGMSLYFAFIHARAHAAAFAIARRFWGARPDFHLITAGVLELGLLLVHGGLVRHVTAAFAGNTYPVPSPNRVFREAVARGGVGIEETTNLTIALRLMAGALGLPFMPTHSIAGTGLAANRDVFTEVDNPFAADERIGVVAALRPDLAILHAYAADRAGNAIVLGPYGEDVWGALGSRRGVLLTVEKLVPTSVIRRNAHLVRIPSYVVQSVSVVPFGAHPQPMTAFGIDGGSGYGEDYAFRREFLDASRSDAGLDAWFNQWVGGCGSHEGYLARLGRDRLDALRDEFAESAWRRNLERHRPSIARQRTASANETMIILAAREVKLRVRAGGYRTVLAGAGIANLAAWLAVTDLRRDGHDVELLAEAGFFGYAPRFGDPYLFGVANMFTNKMHSGFIGVLGALAGGAGNRCLAVVGAGQIDRLGNINSTRMDDGQYLVGSGGANDLGNSASEMLVLCAASPRRLVDRVSYVTTSGRQVRTLATPLGVFEKASAAAPFVLARLAPMAEGAQRAKPERIADVAKGCGWDLMAAPDVGETEPLTDAELATLRLFDPEAIFTA